MHDALHALPVLPLSLPEPRTIEYAGCRLSYRVLGEGSPVLLIQGVGVHGDAWWPQVELLSERYRCLWFDNRGLGRSQPRGAALSVRQMADDARALMDAAPWARFWPGRSSTSRPSSRQRSTSGRSAAAASTSMW